MHDIETELKAQSANVWHWIDDVKKAEAVLQSIEWAYDVTPAELPFDRRSLKGLYALDVTKIANLQQDFMRSSIVGVTKGLRGRPDVGVNFDVAEPKCSVDPTEIKMTGYDVYLDDSNMATLLLDSPISGGRTLNDIAKVADTTQLAPGGLSRTYLVSSTTNLMNAGFKGLKGVKGFIAPGCQP